MKKRSTLIFIIVGVLLLAGVLNTGMRPRNMGPGMMRSSDVFVDNEYEYLVHMIPHHQEAIDNAEILKEYTEREEMKTFAEEIIQTQGEEIELMQGFLNDWYPNEPHEVSYEPMMGDYENLRGEELDRAFLEDMIPHHMEAVMMSQQLLMRRLAEHEEVAVLARDIRNNQRDEIHQMNRWLSDWNDDSSWMFWDNDSSWMSWGNGTGGMMGRSGWPTVIFWMGSIAIILILVVLLMAVMVNRKKRSNDSKSSSEKSAKEMLDIRFARGEVTEEEYLQIRKHIEER